ncbi:MAG TPA: hypothetical protein DDW52_19210 [Planctomycetaceae bacterium]|nr:hypothetical protein [Planctomycetaceae bacterium]
MTTVQRRTMLKAAGVSLALPWLECMASTKDSQTPPPRRSVFICTALGLHPPNLWPTTPGSDYEETEYLKLLREHRNDFTLFSNLQHEDQTGRQPHDSEMTFLTAARKPGMGGFRNSISVDQLAAASIGTSTRFASLTLGTMKAQSQSYTAGGIMIPAETSPARLFAKLFLSGKPEEVRQQTQRLADGQSVLDQLGQQTRRLRGRASSSDNHLLADYLESVREAEKNLSKQEAWMKTPKPKIDAAAPTDIPDAADLLGRTRLLLDLVPLIIQTDSSRVITVMIQDHFVVPKVEGVSGNHHNLSHHGQDPDKIAQLQRIESGIVDSFGSLLTSMKTRREAGGSLLDRTSILFGSNLGNANAHHARNLPIILAGGGFKHGSYLPQREGTPLCNLYVQLLQSAGVPCEQFGQSTGALTWH